MFILHDCQSCKAPCFNYEATGICPEEAKLPPEVCPMFEGLPDVRVEEIVQKTISP